MQCGKCRGFNDNNNNNKHSISFNMHCIIVFSLLNCTLFFHAIKNVSKKVSNAFSLLNHTCFVAI